LDEFTNAKEGFRELLCQRLEQTRDIDRETLALRAQVHPNNLAPRVPARQPAKWLNLRRFGREVGERDRTEAGPKLLVVLALAERRLVDCGREGHASIVRLDQHTRDAILDDSGDALLD